MDGKNFDELTRKLATGVGRRRFLKGVLGGSAAVVTGSFVVRSAEAEEECRSTIGIYCEDSPGHYCCEGLVCTTPGQWFGQAVVEGTGCQCAPHYYNCEGQCIHESHCCPDGGGAACGSYEVCTAPGVCECQDDFFECDGQCISEEHCCASNPYEGQLCGDYEVCDSGTCICEYGFFECDGQCISEEHCCASNPYHGQVCGDYEVCYEGNCVCQEGFFECEGQCISTEHCCPEGGGAFCPTNEICTSPGVCECPTGYYVNSYGHCILVDTCEFDSDCPGKQQVCCGPETDKPGKCVGKGKDGGNRACYKGR